MMRINYDTATVNISVVNEQRNISFQNDISLKTMRVGVLSWEKLKNRETHGRIVSLDQLGSRRAVANLFVIITWTSQKASKLLSQSYRVSCERYKMITSKAPGTMQAQHFLISQRERSIYDSCRCDIGRFRAELAWFPRSRHIQFRYIANFCKVLVTSVIC